MIEMISQGARANLNGRVFEKICIPIFKEHGFEVLNQKEWIKKGCPRNKVVVQQMRFTTIYNHDGKTEFVLFIDNRSIRIENKWQESAGSVDEKFPYMLLNAIEQYPEKEVILIVDGNGYKPGARQWLQDKIDENWLNYKERGKNIKLFTISQFLQWFNKEF